MSDRIHRSGTHFFEDIEPGATVLTDPILVEEQPMIDFARQWDPMPIHVDREAARASQFGQITASSVYTLGLKQLLVKQLLTEDSVVCMLGFDAGKLPAALKAGRRVRLEATWLEKRLAKSSNDRGIVRFRIRLLTDQEEVVLDFVETILVRTRSAPPPDQAST